MYQTHVDRMRAIRNARPKSKPRAWTYGTPIPPSNRHTTDETIAADKLIASRGPRANIARPFPWQGFRRPRIG